MKFAAAHFHPAGPARGNVPGRSGPGRRAFTLVEIALCIAIIGFAIVAIIGVLPTGMRVQKDNRDDTIVQQDGKLLLEAIRAGARGMYDLTNYVDTIVITNWLSGRASPSGVVRYSVTPTGSDRRIVDSEQIVSLLTTPKLVVVGNQIQTNVVVAYMRSITGVAAEKSRRGGMKDFAFRYLVRSEVVPFAALPTEFLLSTNFLPRLERDRLINLRENLQDIRLTLAWPLFERGPNGWDVGPNRKTFRTLVSGGIIPVVEIGNRTNILVAPNQYTKF